MALEAASVVSFVLAFHSALGRRLSWRDSASLGMTAQGVNVLVPAGGTGGLAAVTVIMTRAGLPAAFTVSRMVSLFLITGVATNVILIIVAGIGVATGVLPGHASLAASLLPAVLAVMLIAAVAYLPKRLPQNVPSNRSGWRAIAYRGLSYLSDGIRGSAELLRSRDPLLVLGALGFVLCDLAALAAAFRAVGSSGLPIGTMLLSYTLGQVGSIISLPGTTEGGLVGVFALYGAPLVLATSAILVYRASQTLVPLALGLIGVVQLRNGFGHAPALSVNSADGDSPSQAPARPLARRR
jgi:uncharacterized membrane protein YbhN (UPF0104 family)